MLPRLARYLQIRQCYSLYHSITIPGFEPPGSPPTNWTLTAGLVHIQNATGNFSDDELIMWINYDRNEESHSPLSAIYGPGHTCLRMTETLKGLAVTMKDGARRGWNDPGAAKGSALREPYGLRFGWELGYDNFSGYEERTTHVSPMLLVAWLKNTTQGAEPWGHARLVCMTPKKLASGSRNVTSGVGRVRREGGMLYGTV
ncbi:hypothetical protein K469DRAFT_744408 [Zopfia rhizophila CBS 207.26]|uniref:Uncharacterized protein n=1 Tax=Zopfia rhizophila CBS 207.26 TaxID=1314779 RepID=A0A6A6EU01_9PEZI|nr:hypothetical protein K469DRAFT_744408 [Zopfia rhizophila CBS 207.26]